MLPASRRSDCRAASDTLSSLRRRLAFDVTFEAVCPARSVRARSLIAPCASSALFDALSNLVNPAGERRREREGRGERWVSDGERVGEGNRTKCSRSTMVRGWQHTRWILPRGCSLLSIRLIQQYRTRIKRIFFWGKKRSNASSSTGTPANSKTPKCGTVAGIYGGQW